MVGQQNAYIADTLQLRDVAMATSFVFLCIGCTLAPFGEYDRTVRVRRRCGNTSNYFDHLLLCLELILHIFSIYTESNVFFSASALLVGDRVNKWSK